MNRSIDSSLTTLLKELQYSDEEISNMTKDEVNSFLNSEYAMVTKKVVPIENGLTSTFATDDVESEKQHQNKLTIWQE